MSNILEYKEITAFHPGYYVAEMIEDMGISQAEFAVRLGTTGKTLSKLVNGQISLSNEIAGKLSMMFGMSAESWLNLQAAYDAKCIEIELEKSREEQAEIARQIDYSYFVENAGLPETRDVNERTSNLCRYLKVSDLRIMTESDYLIDFGDETVVIETKSAVSSRAWLQTAVNLAYNVRTESFNAEKLREKLPELRSMTTQPFEEFLPHLQNVFAECGVVFVLLPQLRNAAVNGAVKWIGNSRVLLVMNSRGMDAGMFWLLLFHEIRHILQQKIKTVFVDSDAEKTQEGQTELEKDAEAFAVNILIPQAKYRSFVSQKEFTDEEISSFAESIDVHPGIVAGRLLREKRISRKQSLRFREQYSMSAV